MSTKEILADGDKWRNVEAWKVLIFTFTWLSELKDISKDFVGRDSRFIFFEMSFDSFDKKCDIFSGMCCNLLSFKIDTVKRGRPVDMHVIPKLFQKT